MLPVGGLSGLRGNRGDPLLFPVPGLLPGALPELRLEAPETPSQSLK